MRILVFESSARDQHAVVGQHLDDDAVRIALLAFVGEHARTGEAGGLIRERAILIDCIGNRRVDAARFEVARVRHPNIEVLAPMPGRGVNEAGAGIVRHMITGEQRHHKSIVTGEALKRMRAQCPM